MPGAAIGARRVDQGMTRRTNTLSSGNEGGGVSSLVLAPSSLAPVLGSNHVADWIAPQSAGTRTVFFDAHRPLVAAEHSDEIPGLTISNPQGRADQVVALDRGVRAEIARPKRDEVRRHSAVRHMAEHGVDVSPVVSTSSSFTSLVAIARLPNFERQAPIGLVEQHIALVAMRGRRGSNAKGSSP